MKNKHKDYIIETFEKFLERKYNTNVNEIDEQFTKQAKAFVAANPENKTAKNLYSQHLKAASMQREFGGKLTNKDSNHFYANSESKPARQLKRMMGDPLIKKRDESPITRNAKNARQNNKLSGGNDKNWVQRNYSKNTANMMNDNYDYAAITIGIGVLDSITNENYNFIYEHINQSIIDECLDATYEYLNDYKLTTEDIDYCIESLQNWLNENVDDGITNEFVMLTQFIRNKPIIW